jgi:RNA polymerase sigma-70 factor (ECF subfamily)
LLLNLLERVATGDQAAFGELYDQLAPRVFGLVKRVLRDHAQSEEVTQEIFLEIWQTATRFDAKKGAAVSWTLTMTHRRTVDRVCASQPSRDRDVRIGIRDQNPDYDHVSETIEARLEHKRVQKAVCRLTQLQREAVSPAYHGSYSYSYSYSYSHSEVATILTAPRPCSLPRQRLRRSH